MRHVDALFEHARRYEHVDLAATEVAQHLRFELKKLKIAIIYFSAPNTYIIKHIFIELKHKNKHFLNQVHQIIGYIVIRLNLP